MTVLPEAECRQTNLMRRPEPLHGSTSTYDPEEEEFELDEHGRLAGTPAYESYTAKYEDGRSIDWLREEARERERIHAQRSQRGVRGVLLLWMDSVRLWLVVVATGIGIGLVGAWLDVLVMWYVACWPLCFLYRFSRE